MQPKPHAHAKRSFLPIILIVASVLLLAGVVFGAWWYMYRINSQTPPPPLVDKSETRDVKEVTWVPPTIPPEYTVVDEYTQDVAATVYKNIAAACTLFTRVAPVTNDTDVAVVAALEGPGITSGAATKGKAADFADVDAIHIYPFVALKTDQTVSAPEVSVTSQSAVVYYKQFGAHVASLAITCASGSDQAVKLEQAHTLAHQFKLKTER